MKWSVWLVTIVIDCFSKGETTPVEVWRTCKRVNFIITKNSNIDKSNRTLAAYHAKIACLWICITNIYINLDIP